MVDREAVPEREEKCIELIFALKLWYDVSVAIYRFIFRIISRFKSSTTNNRTNFVECQKSHQQIPKCGHP